MTTIASSDVAEPVAPLRSPAARILVATALVALGDWLLRGPSGSALLLLVLGTALAAAATNGWRADRRELLLAGGALLLGALPLVEDVGVFPVAFALAGLAVFALVLTGQGTPGWLRKPLDIVLLYMTGPQRLLDESIAASRTVRHGNWGRYFSVVHLAGWVVPLGLLGVFALLFADANPVFQRWLAAADPAVALGHLDPRRMALWAVLLAFCLPFLQVRLAPFSWRAFVKAASPTPPQRPATTQDLAAPKDPAPEAVPLRDLLLGREAIARSLVLFNLLFAAQTILDAVYLWGGAELPAGVTYASYAHRGAYPLIATALLAAVFVLAAMRPGGPAQNSGILRGLVYLFVAQNVALVLSSILRLDLYVSVYSLTYWRVAAFVWMGLVAIGLVLIGLRIALRQSNRWLVGANLAAATATLYACCFVNFAAVIAEYNVSHRREAAYGTDLLYLVSLGPDAIPAIDRLIPSESTHAPRDYHPYMGGKSRQDWLVGRRDLLARQNEREMADWRAWTLRGWRLSHYLAANPTPRPDLALPPAPAVPSPAPVEAAPSPR